MAHVTCLCVFSVSSMGRDLGKKGKRIIFNVLPGCSTLSMRCSQILSLIVGSHEATLSYLHHSSSSWKHGTPFSESPPECSVSRDGWSEAVLPLFSLLFSSFLLPSLPSFLPFILLLSSFSPSSFPSSLLFLPLSFTSLPFPSLPPSLPLYLPSSFFLLHPVT